MRYRELEETLCRLPTVDAVRIVESNGDISEVHVLAGPGKPAKQVVRDVQSLAMAAFGVNIDRRVVSVVQIESEDLGRSDRPAILEIKEIPAGAHTNVAVTLSWQNTLFTGEAAGPSAEVTKQRLVGEATLKALDKAISDEGVGLALASIESPSISNRPVAVAMVVMVTGGEERLLVGSALVGTDSSQATVRAVLDAINRLVPHLRR